MELLPTVLFCSLAVLDPRVGQSMDVLFPFIPVLVTDCSTGSPVHLLMLSIKAVRWVIRDIAGVRVMVRVWGYRQTCCG